MLSRPADGPAHGYSRYPALRRFEEVGAVQDVVRLLTDDVWLAMPPWPLEYQIPGSNHIRRQNRATQMAHSATDGSGPS